MSKVAVVTGAANGIGEATARLLVEDGYTVVGFDREPGSIPGVTFYDCDVTGIERHEPLLDRVEAEHGPIDAFANVAGAYSYTNMIDMTIDVFRRQLAVFLEGAVFLSRGVGLRMIKRRSGRIVNVSSTSATHAMASSLAYNTAKGALEAASRSLALELAPHNVLVNIVEPGFVRTRMSNDPESGVNEADTDWFKSQFAETGRLPIKRTAEPAEIAGPIVFLLSPRNTYMSGATVVVDGGLTSTI